MTDSSYVLLFTLMLTGNVQSQDSIPFFELEFYFQDAVGNRDTIQVGYDNEASAEYLNPQFGEIPLNSGFDSVFEIRATHIWGEHTLKRIVGGSEYEPISGCHTATGVWIFINAQYFPITISYDSALLNSTFCHTDAIFSPSWTIYTYEYWWNSEIFYCLSNTNVVVDNFEYYFEDPGAYLNQEFEVEGKGLQELPGYFFEIFLPEGYCHSLVRTNSLNLKATSIYPNPVSDYLTIELQSGQKQKISIINAYGQKVWGPIHCKEDELLVDTEPFAPGHYYLLIEGQNQMNVQKLIIAR